MKRKENARWIAAAAAVAATVNRTTIVKAVEAHNSQYIFFYLLRIFAGSA